jgi:copper chaperone CopZ
MKKIKYVAIALLVITVASCGEKEIKENNSIATETNSGVVTSTFKVWGNCEMCKETIEGSLKVDGIAKADWNKDTKIISVSFDSTKINLDQIQKNVAMVGYDNEKYTGEEKAYS